MKSGDEQVVRIGRVQSSIVATKESLLRLAKQCLSVEEQPYDELTMDAMSLIDKFENHLIPEGGKEQYEGRIRLVDYILEKKPVTESGVPVLSSLSQGDANCLRHLFGVLDSPRELWLEAIQDYRGRGRRGEHETAKSMKKSAGKMKPFFKDCCQRSTRRCFPKTTSMDLTRMRLIMMKKATKKWTKQKMTKKSAADDEEEEEAGEAEAAPEVAKMPNWALNLDVGSIRLPAKGVINNDSSEGAAQLFDNAVLAKVMGMYKHYYKQRVLMTPEDYRAEMTTGRIGRLDLDGICPYTGGERRWVASTSHRRGTRCDVPRQGKEGRVDARRNDVWGGVQGYAHDRHQDTGDL